MIQTPFGQAFQMAFVPPDFDAAIQRWVGLGAGPFYVMRDRRFPWSAYRGEEVGTTIDFALGYWGDVQIEFIRQVDDGPSVYRDWRRSGREGVHHLGVVVPDLAAARARCETVGCQVVQEIRGEGMAIFYAEPTSPDMPMIECMTPPPATFQMFEMLKAAHRDFDGSDPIRAFG